MKLLFINLCARPDTVKKIPNIGLAYVLSSVKRAGYDFFLVDIDLYRYSDSEIEDIMSKEKYDFISFGALSSMYAQAKKMAEIARNHNPEAVIALGNMLATTVYEIVLNTTEVDVCLIAEADKSVVSLIKAVEQGLPLSSVKGIAFKEGDKIVKTPLESPIENLDEMPLLDFEVFEIDKYLANSKHHVPAPEKLPMPFENIRALPINTARGCPFQCTFCSHAFKGYRYRVRSPRSIVDEIKLRQDMYGINFVNFWDELTFPNLKAAEEFADIVLREKVGFKWVASVRSELFVRGKNGFDVAKKLKDAGCHGLAFSLESGNKEILAFMKKGNTVEEFIAQCELLQKADIDIYTCIIVGFPQETFKTIDDTFDVLLRAGVYPSVGFLQLLPGTPLYEEALRRGMFDEIDYLMRMGDRQDLRINLTKYKDSEIIEYTTKKLEELNEKLNMGINREKLIKTGVWRGKGKKGLLRESNFTKD